MFKIFFKASVQKDIRRIPDVVLERIKKKILALTENPYPEDSVKLQGQKTIYRVRVSNYRIVYDVEKEIRIITVIRIGHRKDVYESL